MHRLTRFLLGTSAFWLLASFLLKAAGEILALDAAAVRPTSIHLLVVGWVTQVIIGVSIWMFPPGTGRHPRSDSVFGWFVWGALNLGLLLRLLFEGLLAGVFPPALSVSAVLQGSAVLVYVFLILPRIRGARQT